MCSLFFSCLDDSEVSLQQERSLACSQEVGIHGKALTPGVLAARYLLLQVKDVVHGTPEGQLKGGARDVAIMRGPPPVHATPQLWHHQGAVQAGCYGHG